MPPLTKGCNASYKFGVAIVLVKCHRKTENPMTHAQSRIIGLIKEPKNDSLYLPPDCY
jgi:hypothetical protein